MLQIFQIIGVMPSVLRKVIEIMYGYDMPLLFDSNEVLDCILLARYFMFEGKCSLLPVRARVRGDADGSADRSKLPGSI